VGVAHAADSGVEFEGVKVSLAKARQLQKGGYHRYCDQWLTHNAHDLKKEIDLGNFLNSIQMSEVQTRHVMVLAAKAERARRKYQKQIDAANRVIEADLRATRDMLLKNPSAQMPMCPKTSARTGAAKKQLRAVRSELQKEVSKLGLYSQAVLTPNQREMAYNYEHCLIPVKNLKDPTRVGQASSSSKYEKVLTKVREMDEACYEKEKVKVFAKHIAAVEKKCGEMPKDFIKMEREKIYRVMAQARVMDQLDFQFQKEELSTQMRSDYHEVKERMKELGKQMSKLKGEECGCPVAISGMLLNPKVIPMLAKRLQISKGFKAGTAVDLDSIEAAASCNGVCAID